MSTLNRTALAEQASGSGRSVARAGQATMIEQSRAVAEVQAQVMIAQSFPRNTNDAIVRMKEACAIKELAESAFYKFPRGGQSVTGASIHLARELARCWGNITYGIKELSRDDVRGQSEMMAWAWDQETNVRPETIFIVPHIRDARGKPQPLTDVRDIYENNANHGARRLREQIFSVLPRWFTEQAESACHETLQGGGGEPMAVRVDKMVKAFADLGVGRAQIERKIGCGIDKIDPVILSTLTVTYKSIRRGEIRKEDEFPSDKAAAIEGGLKQATTLPPHDQQTGEVIEGGAPLEAGHQHLDAVSQGASPSAADPGNDALPPAYHRSANNMRIAPDVKVLDSIWNSFPEAARVHPALVQLYDFVSARLDAQGDL